MDTIASSSKTRGAATLALLSGPVVWLQAIDLAFLQYTVAKTLQRSASVHLLFAFEYVIQASIVASTAIKYGLGVVDNLMEGRWESKVCSNTPSHACSPAFAADAMPERACHITKLLVTEASCTACSVLYQVSNCGAERRHCVSVRL